MASWPSFPTSPLLTSYDRRPADVAIRSQMDVGPDKLRRRTTAGIVPYDFTFLATSTEVGNMETFYSSTLQGGSLTFDFTDPDTGTLYSNKWRFLAPPSSKHSFNSSAGVKYYLVNIQLERLP